jgi:outer membrane murein-binding lipoprotein Lpp
MTERDIKAVETYTPRQYNPHTTRKLSARETGSYRSLTPSNYELQGRSAVATAMRTLQNKIKQLEGDNDALRRRYKELEDRYLEERERLQLRRTDDFAAVQTWEVSARDELLLGELRRAQGSVEEHKAKSQILEGKIRLLESEIKRANEEAAIERENSSLHLSSAQRKLRAAEEEVRELKSASQRLGSSQSIKQEELLQAETLISSLKDELSYLRDHSQLQRSTLQSSLAVKETQLAQYGAEYEAKIHRMQVESRSVHELAENYRRQLEYFKRELSQTSGLPAAKASADCWSAVGSRPQSNREEAGSDLRLSQRTEPVGKDARLSDQSTLKSLKSKSKGAKQPRTTGKSLTPRAKKKAKPVPAASPRPQTSRTREDTELDWEIRRLTETIASLSKKYRLMLESSYSSTSDLRALRLDLTSIAEALEVKSNELYRLKRLQQSALRDRMVV